LLSTDFGPVCDFWQSSSSRMHVIYHNWSATKQRPHLQSVAEISHHLVLSGDKIRQCETSSGSPQRTEISVCKSPFPSAGTAVSLFRAKTVQQRPLLPRKVETWLPEVIRIYFLTGKAREMSCSFTLEIEWSKVNVCLFIWHIVASRTSTLISASQPYSQASANTARPWIRGGLSCDMHVYCPSFHRVLIQPATEVRLRLSRPGCLVLRRGGLPVQDGHPPRQALTGPSVE